jgi:hypothetical protein
MKEEMGDPTNSVVAGSFRRYELLILAAIGAGSIYFIEKVLHSEQTVSGAAYVVLSMFAYLSRYILDLTERRKSLFLVAGATIALTLVTVAQVLYIQDIVRDSPAAAIVNMSLTGVFVSTVLYLYLLGGGLDVFYNYTKRFNEKYREAKRPSWGNGLLLIAYVISVGKYLFVLSLMKGILK